MKGGCPQKAKKTKKKTVIPVGNGCFVMTVWFEKIWISSSVSVKIIRPVITIIFNFIRTLKKYIFVYTTQIKVEIGISLRVSFPKSTG